MSRSVHAATILPVAMNVRPVAEWAQAVRQSPVPMLLIDLITLAIMEANAAALALLSRREGHPIALDGRLKIDSSYADILDLLASGRLDGFDTSLPSSSLPAGASEMRAWVRRVDPAEGEPLQAVIVVTEGRDVDPSIRLPGGRPAQLVVGTTDQEWVLEWVTQEITTVLGYRSEEIVGTPLLGL